MTLDQKN